MFDLLCAQHGGLGHVFVHEAAHAVAAVQRRIPFVEVRILPPQGWIAAHGGLMLGGVRLDPDPRTWVEPDPVAALEFALAGAIAELGAFGHHLDGAYAGDITVWRIGAGLSAAQEPGAVDAALGRSIGGVRTDVQHWVAENWSYIRRVAGALAGVADLSQAVLLSFRDDWRLSEAEVRALLT